MELGFWLLAYEPYKKTFVCVFSFKKLFLLDHLLNYEFVSVL